MILSAHRVINEDGNVGINCFHYAQLTPSEEVAPDQLFFLEGTLIWEDLALPPGSHIVSYIDIALPEDVSGDEIRSAFEELTHLEHPPSAYCPRVSRVAFHLHIGPELLPFWKQEVMSLVQHLIHVHP